ncbi:MULTISPECIES: glutaredoxin family protein [Rhodanobacter]|uniref:glutaredoxin family protein n=1 Tax=Rhodanobacter TaxID=75309 RepID=UPI00040A5833|nr:MULTISPECIES: glutaredoxin domain-containing protein [Rhodanobacter]TAN18616.1 MAG: glutaredoxin [Rhodanobacter sp.]UJJ56384.1 glutaredoxin [Rhodanobacter thiooxydans]
MQVIIYGRDHCASCDKTKLLCQMKSITFQYHNVGSDISVDELRSKVGQRTTSLPQIFLAEGDTIRYVGGYDDLRSALQRMH